MIPEWALSRIRHDEDCWIWLGGLDQGRPRITLRPIGGLSVRRALYSAVNGPLPKGKVVRMTCNEPLCVNPEHMRVCTFKSMMREISLKSMSDARRVAKIVAKRRARSKWSDADIAAMRAEMMERSVYEVAAKWGMTASYAFAIRRGDWRRAPGLASMIAQLRR